LIVLQFQLIELINGQFEKVKNMQNALQLVHKFDKISLPGWTIEQLHSRLLQLYIAEVELVAKIYQETKTQPDIARDLPPIAGWSHRCCCSRVVGRTCFNLQ
jgi:hypothetical protein